MSQNTVVTNSKVFNGTVAHRPLVRPTRGGGGVAPLTDANAPPPRCLLCRPHLGGVDTLTDGVTLRPSGRTYWLLVFSSNMSGGLG